ncbi:allantoate deiminase [Robertmurraya massiliosenegalensis]|uniref:allantoate deiminase n=1 Tax=Robertmurraya massiliosenegalensis TaxID=1287657 RepID=UPI0002E02DC8|nr:allantoate deiminase [Robertmurraya massiliosenegalensis]
MAIRVGKQTNKENTVEEMIEWLAQFGKTETGGNTRLLFSKEWKEAQRAIKNKMEEFKLDTYFDSAGNLFGKLQGTEISSKSILTGSHIDTVRNGGKYDGAYGIIASLLATSRLFKAFGYPKKTIEVISLSEEEGSRFPLTFWGSRNINGAYNLESVKNLQDEEGISFLDAMKSAGFDPNYYTPSIRHDIERFIEIHIEQGMVLERNKKSIGVVSYIVGQRRFTVKVSGESNHAGTTPMFYRKDAVTTTSRLITYLTDKAKEIDSQLVATVGKINVKPNVPNVVAGVVEFSLDIRNHREDMLNQYCEDIFAEFERFANELEMNVQVSQWMDVKPIAMDKGMNRMVRQLASNKNISHQDIVSGAGHDAQVFASICPTTLLFVPSQKGISHSPQEFTKLEDLETGVELLTELLYKLAY